MVANLSNADEDLANAILEQGLESGFDLAMSWEAPVDHAFLSPVNTMHGTRPIPPLVPIWVNASFNTLFLCRNINSRSPSKVAPFASACLKLSTVTL